MQLRYKAIKKIKKKKETPGGGGGFSIIMRFLST
jgi:hypothetical protein